MTQIAIAKMTQHNTTDQTLLKKIAKQDQNAFALLYERHAKKMYGYAFRILKNKQTAEDVLQETFLTVWRNAKSYKGKGRPIAWLFGITHNLSLKKYNERIIEPLNEYEPGQQDLEGQISYQITLEKNKEKLQKGLEKLSIDHRTILELVFYEKLSMKEIADICNIPIGTVKSRLNYAKNALKGIIEIEGIAIEDIYE